MTTCEKCGKEFKKKCQKQRFCSGACAGNTRAVIHALVCSYCGVAFDKKIPPSMASAKERFCCLEHAQLHRRKMRATATNCVRCKADLSPKDLVRIGQDRAKWRKAGKGEPPHLCLGCRAEERQAKAERNRARRARVPWVKTERTCIICGCVFLARSQRNTCSDKCNNKKSHRECMADPKKHVSMVMRISIGQALRGEKNRVAWSKLVGYGPDDLIAHIERTMTVGMTWDNYGKAWHIDHIIPVSRFNYEKPTDPDFIRCWSLKNLQAMWATDNIRKSDKIEKPFQPCLAIGV